MNIEDELNQNKKGNKTTTIILVLIILTVFIIIGLLVFMLSIQGMGLKVYIDGKLTNLAEDMLIIDEENDRVYVAIKDIASYLGYESHNGEYKLFSEDTNKCWVNTKDETASFFLNSNKISKMIPDQTKDYEDYIIQEPVIEKNGKLYVTIEGAAIGFNSNFEYSKQNNTIDISTLPYLIEKYTKPMEDYGYRISNNFNNQKAIRYGLFIVRKSNGLYGVVDSQNQEIIGSRYENMTFNENMQEFFVKSATGKVGIVTAKADIKIDLLYDDIQMLDKNSGLYVVKSNNKYGVIDKTGNIVIHLEYDKIGVESDRFPTNNINNKYLLFENAIAVYKERKWGFFDKTGKMIIPVEYDEMGFSTGKVNNKVVNTLLIIPNYKAIVLGKKIDKETRYGIYDYTGNEIVPLALSSAYSITSSGVNTYYMVHNEQERNIEEYIQKLYEYQAQQNQ